MLVFDLRTLAAAVRVDDALEPDDPVWEAGDPTPSEPVRVTGRLSPAGVGGERFYFSGHVTGKALDTCRRCLADVATTIDERVQLLFVAEDADEADDPDLFVFDPRGRELDMRPAIREQWLLSVPRFALCSEECRGLCASCGADLNTGSCECAPPADDRWAGLRAVQKS
jgi:DUF177 domain-containing protein